jgi:CheY-like chemotaxis protein
MEGIPNTPFRILVADDDEGHRKLIELIFGRWGISCRFAEDGQQVLDITAAESFDLIFLDLRMPKVDGYQVAHILRNRKIIVPIIALTAMCFPELPQQCVITGFSDWLVKPITSRELQKLLDRFMPVPS